MDPNNPQANQAPPVQQQAPAEQPVPVTPAPQTPTEEPTNKKMLWGLLAILLVLLAFGGIYFVYLYSTKTVSEEVVETERIEITATPTPEPTPTLEKD